MKNNKLLVVFFLCFLSGNVFAQSFDQHRAILTQSYGVEENLTEKKFRYSLQPGIRHRKLDAEFKYVTDAGMQCSQESQMDYGDFLRQVYAVKVVNVIAHFLHQKDNVSVVFMGSGELMNELIILNELTVPSNKSFKGYETAKHFMHQYDNINEHVTLFGGDRFTDLKHKKSLDVYLVDPYYEEDKASNLKNEFTSFIRYLNRFRGTLANQLQINIKFLMSINELDQDIPIDVVSCFDLAFHFNLTNNKDFKIKSASFDDVDRAIAKDLNTAVGYLVEGGIAILNPCIDSFSKHREYEKSAEDAKEDFTPIFYEMAKINGNLVPLVEVIEYLGNQRGEVWQRLEDERRLKEERRREQVELVVLEEPVVQPVVQESEKTVFQKYMNWKVGLVLSGLGVGIGSYLYFANKNTSLPAMNFSLIEAVKNYFRSPQE